MAETSLAEKSSGVYSGRTQTKLHIAASSSSGSVQALQEWLQLPSQLQECLPSRRAEGQ